MAQLELIWWNRVKLRRRILRSLPVIALVGSFLPAPVHAQNCVQPPIGMA
jgi:hypothetical protein